jgi:exonuclease VII small subunit
MLFEEEKSRLKKHVCDELEYGSMDLDEIRDICRRSKMPGNSA